MPDSIIVASSDDMKFIEGVTPMTQSNWMSYFRHVVSNGIKQGLDVPYFNDYFTYFNPGVTIYNGIISTVGDIDDNNSQIRFTRPTVSEGFNDIFLCARMYYQEGNTELVLKNLSDTYDLQTITATEAQLIRFESYGCTRNSEIYEIPIWYGSYIFAQDVQTQYQGDWAGRDLRRFGSQYVLDLSDDTHSQSVRRPIRLSKSKSTYDLNSLRRSTSTAINIAIDPMSPPESVTLYCAGNYQSSTTINILKQYWASGLYKMYNSGNVITISAPSGWTDGNATLGDSSWSITVPAKTKTIAENDTTTHTFNLKLTNSYVQNYCVCYTYKLTEE